MLVVMGILSLAAQGRRTVQRCRASELPSFIADYEFRHPVPAVRLR